MENLQTLSDNKQLTLDSREVAEMGEITHSDLLKKLEGTTKSDGSVKQIGIIPVLAKGNFPLGEYFIESSYIDKNNQSRKCYLFTKKGCEFMANKFTGEKGILFTAKYVERFNKMKQELKLKNMDSYMIENPVERAKRWIFEQQEKQMLLEEKKKNEPKILFAEAVSNSNDVILVKEMATILTQHGFKIGQNQLFEYLRKYNYLCSRKGDMYNLPTKKYEHLFKVVKRSIQQTDGITIKNTPKINGKGQLHFIKKFSEYRKQRLTIKDLINNSKEE